MLAVAALAVVAASGAGCGSSASPATSTTGAPGPRTLHSDELAGKRYCEILLVHRADGVFSAEVYNTYPLNACPEDQWTAVDTKAVAAADGALLAFRNGPRYWLMDTIAHRTTGAPVIRSFGGIAMIREATVALGTDLLAAQTPYVPHLVDRQTEFAFRAGRQVYELTDPDGHRWVMQSWSQAKDPALAQADLAGLGPRLALLAGWTYGARRLRAPLVVATVTRDAHVLQDTLMDSYSLEASG